MVATKSRIVSLQKIPQRRLQQTLHCLTTAQSSTKEISPRASTRLKEKEKKNYNDESLDEAHWLLEQEQLEELNELDNDDLMKDEGTLVSARKLMETNCPAAAIAADLIPDELTPLEQRELPQVPKAMRNVTCCSSQDTLAHISKLEIICYVFGTTM
jgi:hypothetical protein